MLTLSLTSLQGVAIAIPLAGGIAGSVVTRKAVKEWYPKLKKPSWTPPNWLFGPVWTYLYATMGYASHRIFQRGGWQGNALPLSLYAAQLGESAHVLVPLSERSLVQAGVRLGLLRLRLLVALLRRRLLASSEQPLQLPHGRGGAQILCTSPWPRRGLGAAALCRVRPRKRVDGQLLLLLQR